MASIGSGPGMGPGPQLDSAALRQAASTGGVANNLSNPAATPAPAQPAAPSAAEAAVVTSTAVNAGTAPVDQSRVSTIRKAIQSGNYPIIPTKIGDAMIAAGIMLRTGQ